MGGELLSGQRKANFGFPSLAVHNITDQKTKVNNNFLDELKGWEVVSPLAT
jgi:hypothetical protein